MQFSPRQDDLIDHHWRPERVLVALGAAGSGKTIATAASFALWLLMRPRGGRHLFTGYQLDSVMKNQAEPAMDMLRAMGAEARKTTIPPGFKVVWRGRTHRIEVIGASSSEATGRITGATLGGIVIDEAIKLRHRDYWTMLVTRLRGGEPGSKKLWATTNPGGTRHWFRSLVVNRIDKLNGRVIEFVQSDNPGVSEEDRAAHAAALEGTADYDRLILGKWADEEGAIFPNAPQEMPPDDRDPDEAACGLDWAASGTFAAVLLLRYGERWYAAAERIHHIPTDGALGEGEQVDRTKDWIASHTALPCPVYGDPTTPAAAQMRIGGAQTWFLDADNAVKDGLNAVRTGFAERTLVVSPSCKHLLAELSAYVWDEKAAEKGEDKPLKRADHAVDSLRYAFMGICEGLEREVVISSASWY